MSGPRYQVGLDGISVDAQDFNLFAAEAARAEDWVLAELLRMPPLNGTTVSKAIQPYAYRGQPSNVVLVAPNGPTGAVKVFPFRVVVGSRTALSAAVSTDPTLDTTTQLAWRDVRSALYAVSDDNTTFGHAVSFAANASGNARWDLVYATMTVDTPQAAQTLFVKPPAANVGSPTSISRNYLQTVTLSVVTGTPAGSPTLPALPADNLGLNTYNIPLAYVSIQNGFTSGSSISAPKIWTVAPFVPISQQAGQANVAPASASWDPAVFTATQIATWGSTGVRPVWGINQGITSGGKSIVFALDSGSGAPSTWNVIDAGLVDNSIDWRNRLFLVTMIDPSAGNTWAFSNGAASNPAPSANYNGVNTRLAVQFGQSFVIDDNAVLGITTRNGAVVCVASSATMSGLTQTVALYVDTSTGFIRMYASGAIASKLFFWIQATGQMDNV